MHWRTFMQQRAAYLPTEYNVVPAEDSSCALSPALLGPPASKKKLNSKDWKMHYIQYKQWLMKLYQKYSDNNDGYTE